MKTLANLSNAGEDWSRFAGADDVRAFLRRTGMDGFELLLYEDHIPPLLPAGAAKGVHLGYFPSWLPFWLDDREKLLEDYGTLHDAYACMRARSRQEMVDAYTRQLDAAAALKAEYVVFHVSEASPQETVSYRFRYRDEQVIDCAAELIGAMLRGRSDPFYFLVENLWWPGFRFTDARLTERLLRSIPSAKAGIMLDVGHLLHTNRELNSLWEGVAYIRRMLERHGQLCSFIRGVHLHQSLSGAYVNEMVEKNIRLKGAYMDRLMEAYLHVMRIDTHRPFLERGMADLIRAIDPAYLIYEFITESRAQHEDFLLAQQRIFSEQGEGHVFHRTPTGMRKALGQHRKAPVQPGAAGKAGIAVGRHPAHRKRAARQTRHRGAVRR